MFIQPWILLLDVICAGGLGLKLSMQQVDLCEAAREVGLKELTKNKSATNVKEICSFYVRDVDPGGKF